MFRYGHGKAGGGKEHRRSGGTGIRDLVSAGIDEAAGNQEIISLLEIINIDVDAGNISLK